MQKFLCLDGKLHRELVHDLFGVTVDDESDGVLEGYTPLLAVEELILVDLGGRCLMFDGRRGVGDDHVGESVRAAFITQEERVALTVITRVLGMDTHLHESPVRVLAMARRDTFGDDTGAGVFADVDHLRSGICLLVVISEGYGVELRRGVIAAEDAGGVFPSDGRACLDLCPREARVLVGDNT